MTKSKVALIVTSSLLAIGLITMTTLFIVSVAGQNKYKNELSNLYMKNMYNFVENVEDMEVGLSKIMATNSPSTQKDILRDIYTTTTEAASNISNLPIAQLKSEKVTSLINRLGGFVYSLISKTEDNNKISSEDYNQLESLYSSTKSLLYDINEYISTTKNRYDILKDINFSDGDSSSYSAGIYTEESSASKTPSLIYDGPFSDSVINKEIKGLGSTIYSKDDAIEIVERVYPDSYVTYVSESSGVFASYNYKVTGDTELYVSVTKQGGLILSITGYGTKGGIKYSVEEGVKIAENFAKNIGLDDMHSVWTQSIDSVLYVNLAPIVDRVIYYPDLVKVKVDLVTGSVIGMEATNYAYNHTDREPYKTSTSILTGDDYLSDRLEVIERNYVVIPNKWVGESRAYEYICEWEGYTYYVYLDVEDYSELKIMRVIETKNGSLIE